MPFKVSVGKWTAGDITW